MAGAVELEEGTGVVAQRGEGHHLKTPHHPILGDSECGAQGAAERGGTLSWGFSTGIMLRSHLFLQLCGAPHTSSFSPILLTCSC